MKKVLIITYYFPPRQAIASVRLGGLTKHLSKFGWEPVILTPILPDTPDPQFKVIQTPYYDVIDSWKKRVGLKTYESVKKQVRISTHKNKKSLIDHVLFSLLEIIAYPDPEKGWFKFAVDAGSNLLKEESFDAIISSSSPVTSHLIAKELKNKYEIPWIADLRDLWTQNHYFEYSYIRKFIERRLELKTLSKADVLVTVSNNLAETLGTLHTGKQIHTITNGFDPQEINTLHTNLTTKFTITYTGFLYHGKRDPSILFKAVQDLIYEGELNPNDIKIQFYGPKEEWMWKEIQDHRFQGIVNDYGVVSREIALEKQKESQILLLILWNHPEEMGICPAKVFEYLAAQRPILAIGGPPEGVIKELLNDTNAGVYASTIDDVKKALARFYREYKLKGNVEYGGEIAKIDKYSHKEMARKFANVLDGLTRK